MKPAFDYVRHSVFGWVIHQKMVAAGEGYRADVPVAVEARDSGNITLWTKGCIRGTRPDGSATEPRVPGSFNQDRGIFEPGEYQFVAQEDSEWWCINWIANRRSLPEVRAVRLAVGEMLELKPGDRLLICAGQAELDHHTFGPASALSIGSSERTLVATQPTYGMLFDRSR